MFSKLNNGSLVDNQIRMNLTLLLIICPVYFFIKIFYPPDSSQFMTVIIGLLIANWPFFLFFNGVHKDKGWILSVMCIEDGNVINKAKFNRLQFSSPLVTCMGIIVLLQDRSIKFYLAIYLIYFISRLITQIMGLYIYWIARMNNDPKLKINAPDDRIIEQSMKFAKTNYGLAVMFVLALFISLAGYLFVECTFPVVRTLSRVRFMGYSILLLVWIMLSLMLGQIFDKNVVLLHSIQQGFIDKQFTTIKEIFPKRLFLMKFVLALFLFWEMVILPVVIRIVYKFIFQWRWF